jgi:HEXXH motif-containing protein
MSGATLRDRSAFGANAERARAVDQSVRSELRRSFQTIFERFGGRLGDDGARLGGLLTELARSPARPGLFGLYTELVESLSAEEWETAQGLADRILSLERVLPGTRIVTLDDGDLGTDQAERYARLVDDDPERAIYIQPVTDKSSAAATVTAALDLIEASAPGLAGEIRALTREIVMVEPDLDPDTGVPSSFDGASTFYLWGAVFTTIEGKSPVDIAQTLAHETGHLLLFGSMMGRPLVENDDEERYDSPLRRDPRPMEGVVHAAYVMARMHYVLAAILRSGKIPPDQRQEAEKQLRLYIDGFVDSLTTIDAHARFTERGAALFAEATEYMLAQRSAPSSAA